MQSNSVSFKAIPVNTAKIPVKNAGKWLKEEVTLVRFNPRLNSDMATLKGVQKRWHGQNMSASIEEEARIVKSPVYGLVRQNSDFKNIDEKNVLGLFTTDKIDRTTDSVEIYRLGTNPEYAYAQKKRHRDMKHIGSTMIKKFVEFLDSKTNVQKVTIASEPESVKFYRRMHIPERENGLNVFELNKDQFQSFAK